MLKLLKAEGDTQTDVPGTSMSPRIVRSATYILVEGQVVSVAQARFAGVFLLVVGGRVLASPADVQK